MRTQEIEAYRVQALHVIGQLLRISAVRELADEARRLSDTDLAQLARVLITIEHNYHALDHNFTAQQKIAAMEAMHPQLLKFGALLMQFAWGQELVDLVFKVHDQRNVYRMV